MKRTTLFLTLLFAAFALFNFDCNKDTKVAITLNPSDSVVQLAAGETYQVQVTLTPDAVNKGTVGKLQIAVNGENQIDTTFDSENSVTYDYSYTVPETAEAGSTITITFTATDGKSGNATTESVDINVIQKFPATTKTTVTMNFTSTDYANSEMIAQFNADGVNLVGEPQDGTGNNGDLTFVYQSTVYGNCILSPNNSYPDDYGSYNGQDYYYGNKNQTLFVKDNTIDFDNLTDEDINNLVITEDEAGTVGNYGYGYDHVEVGDIFKFKTADGRKGVLKVTDESQPNPAKGDVVINASLTFEVIYQNEASASSR